MRDAVGEIAAVRSCHIRRYVASPVEMSMRGWDNRPAANTTARLAEEISAGAGMLLILGDISYARGFAAIWEVRLSRTPSRFGANCLSYPVHA